MKKNSEEKNHVERRLMTVEEVAAYLGIAPQTIYNQIHRRAKKKFFVKPKRIGRSIRFDKNEIDRAIEEL